MPRAATELAKLWRTDRMLRRLEAVLVVVDSRHSLLVERLGRRDPAERRHPRDRLRRRLRPGRGAGPDRALERSRRPRSSASRWRSPRGIDIYTNRAPDGGGTAVPDTSANVS